MWQVSWNNAIHRSWSLPISKWTLCLLKKIVFTSFEAYLSHMNNKHGLPVWPASTAASTIGSNDDNTTPDQPHRHLRSTLTPAQTAFNGSLKKFDLNFKEEETDLLDFLMWKKEIIDDLVFGHHQQRSTQMQRSVEERMIKHTSGEEEEPGKTMLYLNTDMVRVDYGGLERGQFVEMIEHMLNTINCFASLWKRVVGRENFQSYHQLCKSLSYARRELLTSPKWPEETKLQPGQHWNKKQQQKFSLLLCCSIPFEKWACSLPSIKRIP